MLRSAMELQHHAADFHTLNHYYESWTIAVRRGFTNKLVVRQACRAAADSAADAYAEEQASTDRQLNQMALQ